MNGSLFCYGTLQSLEVFEGVVGATYRRESASLEGYASYRVSNADYPGVKLQGGGLVQGFVYHGLGKSALRKLDLYEGEMYRRLLISVETDKGQNLKAWTYAIKTHWLHQLTNEPWRYEDFESLFLKRFRQNRSI